MWGMMTLTQYLSDQKLTQAEFAAMIDATQGTVSKLCANRRPSWDLAMKIERVTGGKVPVSVWPTAHQEPAQADDAA